MTVRELLKKEHVYLDGAMGTMLQRRGLSGRQLPELYSFTNEAEVSAIYTEYAQSGSDILYANTFGANRYKLAGSGYTVGQVISQAVSLAKKTGKLVALSCGPTGKLIEPLGEMTFEEAYETYKEMVVAGEAAGADLIVVETMTDLYEAKAAVLAAKENTELPVFCTMSFEKSGRTFTGCTVRSMAYTLEGLGTDAIGINCSLGPAEIYPIAEELAGCTALPLIIKANAGLPDTSDGHYGIGAEEFSGWMKRYCALGVSIMGGCCGTTPEYIRMLRKETETVPVCRREVKPVSVLCTAQCVVTTDRVRVIGERINPTGKKKFSEALRQKDFDLICETGADQADAGAEILDVNVGLPDLDEEEMMRETVKMLQSFLKLPLQIDSANPKAIEAGLRVYNGKALVNSVNGSDAVLQKILPIVKKYGAAVVGLTMDENGIPKTAEERVRIAEKIVAAAQSFGIKKEDIYIDCLTLTVSAEQAQARETLRAVKLVTEKLGVKTVLGVSNISFGLPERELITAGFLIEALQNGLTLPILNPNQKLPMEMIRAFRVLCGEDEKCEEYLRKFAKTENTAGETTLRDAVLGGNSPAAQRLTKILLEKQTEEEIIDTLLIPALDSVGEMYESGVFFLPQLLSVSEAASAAFEVLKASIRARGAVAKEKGRIILATVRGDIHDIGKNIVKTVLENYGFSVTDLGRDVRPQKILETAMTEKAGLVGLSALMTTTLPAMEETVRLLRANAYPGKIMVGGAVVNAEFAEKIGADYYAKDAKQSADIAKAVLV